MSLGNPLAALPQRISIISKLNIRYEGFLSGYDPQRQVVTLSTVQQWGTEDRETNEFVPPSNDLYEYIIFRGTDIKEIIQAPIFSRPPPFGAPPGGSPFTPAFNNFGYPPFGAPAGFPPQPAPAAANKPLEFPTETAPLSGVQADSQSRANTGSSPVSNVPSAAPPAPLPPKQNDNVLNFPSPLGLGGFSAGLDVKSLSQPFESQQTKSPQKSRKPLQEPLKKSKADEEATWRSEMTREDMNDPLKNTPLQPEREARPAHPKTNPRHGQPKQEQEGSTEVANPVAHAPPSKSFFSGRGGNHSGRGGRNQPPTNSNPGTQQQQAPRDGHPPRPKTRGARGGGAHNGPRPSQTNGTDGTAPTDAAPKIDRSSPKDELRSGLGRGPRRGRNDGRGTGRPTPAPTAGEGPTNPAEHPEFDFDASLAAFDKEKLFAEIEHEKLIAAKPPTAERDFFDNISRDDKDPGDRNVQQQRKKDQQTFGPRVGREGGGRRPPSNPGANRDASAPRPPSTGDRGRRGGRGRGGGRGKPNYREKGAPSESAPAVPVAESS